MQVQNFFAKIPFQQCKGATWYHFRRSQWQNITPGVEEFHCVLSRVAYFHLFSPLVALKGPLVLLYICRHSKAPRGGGELDLGLSWPDSLTPYS